VFGKMKTFDDFYTYVRQRNTSEGAASVSHFAKSLYLNNWMDKFDRYIVALSSLMLSVDQKQDQEIIALKIRNFYVTYEMNKDTPFTTKEKINLLANHVVSFIDNKTRFRKEIPYYRKVTSYILFNITLYKRNSSDRFFYKKISDLITQKFNFF